MREQEESSRWTSGWGWLVLLGAALAAALAALSPLGAKTDPTLVALAERAAGGDLEAARSLRAAGPLGLSALVDAGVAGAGRPDGYRAAIDLVCAQVECSASHLYWYTDFDAARDAAAVSGKPIVALRLLGRLDEELSCANSRYFRLLLYSDPRVAEWMREKVILYWSSERPVPRVTIDYGDGRRLVGTVTGNSIHYMLDARGRVVDALPGLATPDRFLAWLRSSGESASAWSSLDDVDFAERSREEHRRAGDALVREARADLVAQGWTKGAAIEAVPAAEETESSDAPATPTAVAAAPLAVSKAIAEAPTLAAIGMSPLPPASSPFESALAANERWQAHLSREARGLIAARVPDTVREDLDGALTRMELRLAEDGVRNEVSLHRRIHAELAAAKTPPRWEELNRWVYATLFLTPASDPWLGLAPTEALWGLREESLTTPAVTSVAGGR